MSGGDDDGANDGDAAELKFGYGSGAKGPEHWGSIALEFAQCSEGSEQSPIALEGQAAPGSASLSIAYAPSEGEVERLAPDEPKGVELLLDNAGSITVDGQEYEFDQAHAHGPSEHTLDGQAFPMEVHIINRDDAGAPAVLGVFVTEGAENPVAGAIVDAIPAGAEDKERLAEAVDLNDLLPDDLTALRYSGSLTTPPCSEPVSWSVFTTPITMSAAQIDAILATGPEPNSRPLQPLNGRAIEQVVGVAG